MKATLALGVFVGALALAPSAEAGVSVGIGVAVGDGHDRYDRHGSAYWQGREAGRQSWRLGYDRGFREGLEHGSSDSRKRRGFNYWHSSDYRDADDGYRRHYGPKPQYESGFREGYEAGYRRGYARHGVIYEAPPRRW